MSSDAKYTWNKIVWEQMEADPFKDLKGMSRNVIGHGIGGKVIPAKMAQLAES